MNREARQFTHLFAGKRHQRGAADDQPVQFRHHELVALPLQNIPGPAHQHPLLLQRPDQLDDAGDVVGARGTQRFVALLRHLRASADVGEQFRQQRAVIDVAHHVGTGDAAARGAQQGIQAHRAAAARAHAVHQRLQFRRREFAQHGAAVVQHAGLIVQHDEFVGRQRGGDGRGQVVGIEVERFPRRGVAQGRQQHDVADVQLGADARHVYFAHLAGEAQIDPVHDPHRPRCDEVAAHHPHPCVVHRRAGHAGGQPCLDLDLECADHPFDDGHRALVGDAQVLLVARRTAGRGERGLDLLPRAVHEHQAHAEAGQQRDVVGDRHEVGVGQRVAAQRQHEGPAAMGIDVGGRAAQPLHEFGVVHGGVIAGKALAGGGQAARSVRPVQHAAISWRNTSIVGCSRSSRRNSSG